MRATDPNLPTDSLTYSLEGPIPAGMAISPTGMITWVPSASHEGTHHVNVRVKDRGDLYVTQSVSVTVNANLPPVIISKPSMTAKVGVPYSYTLRAWDPNGSSGLTYISRYGNPGNLTINATTGVVTWTPTADQTGNIVIRLRVTDSGKLAAEQTYYVKVAP